MEILNRETIVVNGKGEYPGYNIKITLNKDNLIRLSVPGIAFEWNIDEKLPTELTSKFNSAKIKKIEKIIDGFQTAN